MQCCLKVGTARKPATRGLCQQLFIQCTWDREDPPQVFVESLDVGACNASPFTFLASLTFMKGECDVYILSLT